MDLLRLLLRKVRSRRGSPTVEYLFVMVAAAMLAGIVVGIVKSEPVQASLRQVILCSVPFLYDENGEPSCKAGKYMAKEDPEPEPPAEETNPLQLATKPDLENQPRPVKSDPPWYECALSWNCIKKKGGELKDHLLEKIRKEAVQHCGSDADCIRDYMEKRVGADIAGLLFPHLSSQSGKLGKFFGIDPWFEFSSFVMDHPTFSLGVVSTIIALFVSPPLGGTMLVSGAVSGGISWWEGNDLDTILRDAGIGGFAGVFGYGVFAGVSRYVGARLAQSTLSPFAQKWLPKIIGGGSGGVADQSAFDWLRDRKFDWRSATIAGMIGMLIPYAGAVIDGSPALGKQLQQMIPGVSGDGTLAMPWVKKNGQEAAEGYNKATGKGGGTHAPFKASKPPKLQSGDPNFSFTTVKDKDGNLIAHTSDGRKFKVRYGEKANTTETGKSGLGREYSVSFDKDAFPDFSKYAIKDKEGNPIEVILPSDALVGSSSDQTRYATQLMKEKYPNWETDLGFSDSQIDSIRRNQGSIGPTLPAQRDMTKWSPSQIEDAKQKLTWHHDKETGKLILVPWDLNDTIKHTGGHKFWGRQKVK